MWHVRTEIAPAILLVVDFGGWFKLDSKITSRNSSQMIQHTQVSLLKDVIVPYTRLLPTLLLSENKDRPTLLYFKGAKHRHRVCTSYHTIQHLGHATCLVPFISNLDSELYETIHKHFIVKSYRKCCTCRNICFYFHIVENMSCTVFMCY